VPAEYSPGPRIFCIGRNYAEHIRELGDASAEQCIVFMKPYTSLVRSGQVVYIPCGLGAVHHELELVLEIGREGSQIPAEHATRHISAITLGIDLTLRELQTQLKQAGSPWERSKAFDHSAPMGELLAYRDDLDLAAIDLELRVNGELRQSGNTRDLLFPVPQLIEILSQTWRLLPGDLVYTGTPPGVGPLVAGDLVEVESPQIGRFRWPIKNASH
jgi:2-keto-4-pentenoate hydratase/2-oxohepta-3-ene-1,7-dioic acid hydratase in catechol pathway